MNVWEYTNKQDKPEVVTINGERFLKVPQISRKRSYGSREIHPAFINNGVAYSHIYQGKDEPFQPKGANT